MRQSAYHRAMRCPAKTLADLEWHRLLAHLADRCTGAEAADACRTLPFLELEAAAAHLACVAEIIDCVSEGDPPPSLPIRPLEDWIDRIRSGGTATATVLLDVAANLKMFVEIYRYLDNRRDTCPKNAALVAPTDGAISAVSAARLAVEIDSTFEPDGTIADGASPALGGLRRQIVSLRKRLISRLEHIADREGDLLQERNITIRSDRFVLPVRADAHRRIPGIVHGASGSGATVFVEPEAVIEAGNALMLAREEAAREEARILRHLSDAVRDDVALVATARQTCIDVETRIATAKLALDLDAVIPKIADPGQVALIDARHPLLVLDGIDVVPTTIHCTPGKSLIISGPNAGGKTVALKTVGLISLMLAAGLPIPARADASLGVPRHVLTDIGDDQSLQSNLSTFSAHMTNISSILASAGTGSIVLLDELAAGTDPSEGAALAEAILEQLSQKGATTLTTTHFETLKARAQTESRFENAAVGFDVENMQPTFVLRLGTPGSSSALAVARRFGISDRVVDRARKILPDGMRELTAAVEALEQEQTKATLEREAFTRARQVAEDKTRSLEKKRNELKAKQSKFVDKELGDLWQHIRRSREKIRDAEKTLVRRRADKKTVSAVRSQINNIAQDIEQRQQCQDQGQETLPGTPARAKDMVPGRDVFITSVGAAGRIETPMKSGRAYVRIGNVKVQAAIEDLRDLGVKPRARPTPKAHLHSAGIGLEDFPSTVRTRENTVDLRGMTGDEAVTATDAFLDQALASDWPAIYILHGHGTGVLRRVVREYLLASRYVKIFRPGDREEGGDGITVAWLNEAAQ
ncbi:MAG: Smr/MutS family protein [Myxococcota bacterium]|nr:Smr/MutS family protein [Myxococcota bacterium]